MKINKLSVIVCLIVPLYTTVRAEFAWESGYTTGYNQGRRIVYDPANNYLHVVINDGDEAYSWSPDGGATWLPNNTLHREYLPWLSFGTYGGAISIDPNGKPWITSVHPGGIENFCYTLQGGVKVGGEWHTGGLFGYPGTPPCTVGVMGYSVTAVSKYRDPDNLFTAYTLVPVHKYFYPYPNWPLEDTRLHALYLIAWGIDNHGCVIPYSVYEIDQVELTGQTLPYLQGSIAVQKDWNGDIIHLVWRGFEPLIGSKIYHNETRAITPAQIRAGQRIQWQEQRFPVSEDHEPADYPSADFWDDSPVTPINDAQLIVVWHGPDPAGRFPGDVWKRIKKNDRWYGASCISQGASPQPVESRYPQASTPNVVVWQEEVNGGEIYGSFWGEIVPVVHRDGRDQFPQIAVEPTGDLAVLHCHTLWTRADEREIRYLRYDYVPRLNREGGLGDGGVWISENDLWLEVISLFGHQTRLRYYLPSETRLEMTVYDLSGRVITKLYAGKQGKGWHELIWNGTDQNGRTVGTGSYLWVLKTPRAVKVKPVRLMR
ncbi:MAG: FlgD immunoglobulin-like domain containing protein [candidate division WOR-3 bacterium]